MNDQLSVVQFFEDGGLDVVGLGFTPHAEGQMQRLLDVSIQVIANQINVTHPGFPERD